MQRSIDWLHSDLTRDAARGFLAVVSLWFAAALGIAAALCFVVGLAVLLDVVAGAVK